MLRLLKWLLIALLAALLAAVVGVVWYSRAVQPQLEGELRLAGLPGPVEVRRDAEGVPHIRAQREAEAQYALGFVHAQDRLWQMEVNRRVAAGRLAEILGAPALDADRFLRTLGVRRAAEAQWKNLDAPTRALYTAYAAGVNAYLAQRAGPLPPEFLLTRAPAPEPWSPVDSLGWMIMMAWDLGGNWGNELMRLRLAQHGLAQARIAEVLPPYRDDPAPVVADYSTLYRQLAPQAAALSLAWNATPGYVEGTGSNNWVVGGAKSATGKPLLANDPHLGLSAPALWYFAHLESADGLAVIGATLPGVPGVILGRNRSIAWGFTNTAPDVQDLYIEQLDPNDATRYRTPEGWAAFAGDRGAHRGQGRGRGEAEGARLAPRAHRQRRRPCGDHARGAQGPRHRLRLDRARPGQPHRRGRAAPEPRAPTGPSSSPRCGSSTRRSRTWSTPTWAATSASSRRRASPCASPRTTCAACTRRRAGTRATTGPAGSPSTNCRAATTRPKPRW